jgi:ribosome-associated protein
MNNEIPINDSLSIARSELEYRATRSGGPGGQHVNTSSTKIELTWDVGLSPSITEEQRATIRARLANRIDDRGVFRLTSSGSRSQLQNREDATDRFARLIADALRVRKARKKTRPPRRAKEARHKSKQKRSDAKRLRKGVGPDD